MEKVQWKKKNPKGLSASMFGAALGLMGRVSDFVVYHRDIVGTELEFTGNAATAHGIESEDIARKVYELLTGDTVQDGGFFSWIGHGGRTNLGASPDGIVLGTAEHPTRLLEIKSPFKRLYDGRKELYKPFGIPQQYMCQMQGQMAISGAPECDFFTYLHRPEVQVVAFRVFYSQPFWNWALPKLAVVSEWIAEGLPPDIDRRFEFPPFPYEVIRVEPLISPVNLTLRRYIPLSAYGDFPFFHAWMERAQRQKQQRLHSSSSTDNTMRQPAVLNVAAATQSAEVPLPLSDPRAVLEFLFEVKVKVGDIFLYFHQQSVASSEEIGARIIPPMPNTGSTGTDDDTAGHSRNLCSSNGGQVQQRQKKRRKFLSELSQRTNAELIIGVVLSEPTSLVATAPDVRQQGQSQASQQGAMTRMRQPAAASPQPTGGRAGDSEAREDRTSSTTTSTPSCRVSLSLSQHQYSKNNEEGEGEDGLKTSLVRVCCYSICFPSLPACPTGTCSSSTSNGAAGGIGKDSHSPFTNQLAPHMEGPRVHLVLECSELLPEPGVLVYGKDAVEEWNKTQQQQKLLPVDRSVAPPAACIQEVTASVVPPPAVSPPVAATATTGVRGGGGGAQSGSADGTGTNLPNSLTLLEAGTSRDTALVIDDDDDGASAASSAVLLRNNEQGEGEKPAVDSQGVEEEREVVSGTVLPAPVATRTTTPVGHDDEDANEEEQATERSCWLPEVAQQSEELSSTVGTIAGRGDSLFETTRSRQFMVGDFVRWDREVLAGILLLLGHSSYRYHSVPLGGRGGASANTHRQQQDVLTGMRESVYRVLVRSVPEGVVTVVGRPPKHYCQSPSD